MDHDGGLIPALYPVPSVSPHKSNASPVRHSPSKASVSRISSLIATGAFDHHDDAIKSADVQQRDAANAPEASSWPACGRARQARGAQATPTHARLAM